tara:strand:+ start:1933 stop:3102 length:1170 start_codon:yes stop_codon:yes gene_type:complete
MFYEFTLAEIAIFFIISYFVIEILFFLIFPKLLSKNEFDDKILCQKDTDIGWKQKKNINFKYFHKHMPMQKSKNKLNNLGILDIKNYKKKKEKYRVAIFGDTYFCGFDFGYKNSLQKILNDYGKNKDVEFIFCFQKNYSTIHMYRFYKKFIKKLKPDIILYIFNSNHPRRNITIHESFKNIIFTQNPYNFKTLKILKGPRILNKFDLAYMDKKNKIIFKKYNSKFNLRRFMYNNLYIYSKLDDYFVPGGLRNFYDIGDIRKIEKEYKINLKNYPYHWKIFKNIVLKWRNEAVRNKSKFIICRNFVSYHYSLAFNYDKKSSGHDAGYKLSELPEIKYLEDIKKKYRINLFNFKNILPKKEIFIHQRYGYYNKDGIFFFSRLMIKVLNKFI